MKHETEYVNEELTHLQELLNGFDFLSVQWLCDCHCGLVIIHYGAKITLMLRYDEEEKYYTLNASIPEESFRGQMFQFQSLIEINNYISMANRAYPENAISIHIDITPMDDSNIDYEI